MWPEVSLHTHAWTQALEDYDEGVKVEDSEPAADSPTVGEKRQREDDDPEDHANGHSSAQDESQPQQDSHSESGGVYNAQDATNGGHGATNGATGGGAMAGGANPNFDALYIGDLQWVRHTVLSITYMFSLKCMLRIVDD